MKRITLLLFPVLALFFLCVSCKDELEVEEQLDSPPALLRFSFNSNENSELLISDVVGEIVGDSIVVCRVPYILKNKSLIPSVLSDADSVFLDAVKYKDHDKYDFKKPVKLSVFKGYQYRTYNVYVNSFTGLPLMRIETEDRQEIVSKEEYIKAHFRLEENVVTRSAGDIVEETVFIKGRGNSSWEMPKKGYRLKFDKKISLIDEPMDKSWVLVPNYSDKTSIRNALAFYMGQHSALDWTPKSHFVDLMLNGKYHGLYQLCEKIRVSENRVNVGKDGFLLEIDFRADSEPDVKFFRIPHIVNGIAIKEPDVQIGDEKFNEIELFMNKVDSVLFSDNFKDPINGWQKFIDIDTFVDWYLINEISKNTDARQTSSIYLNCKPGGKLKMGPIWDFDIAFGNCSYRHETDGFWIKEGQWYSRLFEDPVFVERVKERFNYFYGEKEHYLLFVNDMANYLRYSVQENENRWGTFYNYTWANYDIWGSYQNEIQSLKYWLCERLEWLNQQYGRM